MVKSVEAVEERLLKSTRALAKAGIPYAVACGNAVAAWVDRVDSATVRNTCDVDLMIRREDLPRVTVALEAEGFVYRHAAGIDMFLEGPGGKARDAVHLIFSGVRVRPTDAFPNPEVDDSEDFPNFRVLSLTALVQVKLAVHRDKDRTHLRDFIDVGLVDDTWPATLPPLLGQRLQDILDTPEG